MARIPREEGRRYRVELKRSAAKELRSLPATIISRIDEAITALGSDPRPPGAKKLVGEENLYRIRVGDYRIVYLVRDDVLVVLVIRIAHRREVYRDL